MEWDERGWKTDEKTFFRCHQYLFSHYMYILSHKFSSSYIETLLCVISEIYIKFGLKWDQAMLCLDNFYTFKKKFLMTQLTPHLQRVIKKLLLFGFFDPLVPLLT